MAIEVSVSPAGARARPVSQPVAGLVTCAVLAATVVVLELAAGGGLAAADRLGPLVAFATPGAFTVALWWHGWPVRDGSRPRSGALDTALIVAAGIGFALLAEAVLARTSLSGLLGGHGATARPADVVGAAALGLIVLLVPTVLLEGWPGHRLGDVRAGAATFAVAVVAGLAAARWLVTPHGPVAVGDLGSWTTMLVGWIALLFFAWGGWPFTLLARRWVRRTAQTVAVLALTEAAWRLTRDAPATDTLVAGFIAGVVVHQMAFEGWLPTREASPGRAGRAASAAGGLLLGSLLLGGLTATAQVTSDWSGPELERWLRHICLGVIPLAAIEVCLVFGRWPLPLPPAQGEPA